MPNLADLLKLTSCLGSSELGLQVCATLPTLVVLLCLQLHCELKSLTWPVSSAGRKMASSFLLNQATFLSKCPQWFLICNFFKTSLSVSVDREPHVYLSLKCVSL